MSDADRINRFGDFHFDRRACELLRDGRRIRLQIQPSRVLGLLMDRAGEVVTRAELRETIWPSTIHVDFDHGLNNAITRLRLALDDSASDPRYIETVPRVGYRFICPLEPLPAEPDDQAGRHSLRKWPMRTGLAALAVLLVGSIAALVLRWENPAVHVEMATGTAPAIGAEAYDDYLRGLEFFEQRNKESLALGIEYLTKSIDLAPEFAPAHAALAMTLAAAGGNTAMRYLHPDEVRARALQAAGRALDLDPGLARAHLALALVLNHLQPPSAATDMAVEASFLRALEIDPADPDNSLQYGNFLSTRNRSDEAVEQYHRALALNPLSPSINSRLGMELVTSGSIDEGVAYLKKTVELDPWQYNAHLRLGWVFIALGDVDAAEGEFRAAERISPDSVHSLAGLAYVAARRGDLADAHALLDVVLPAAELLDAPFDAAIVFVALRDRDNALEWLARTAAQTNMLRESAPWGIDNPLYDWLREDERFAQIERTVAAATASASPADTNL